MHIYLKHPTHGTKVAISDGEAAYDEGFGWVQYDPCASQTEQEPVQTEEDPAQEMPDFLTNNLKTKRKNQRKTEEV